MCSQRQKNPGSIPVLYKQIQPEDATLMFKKVSSSPHKFISRGKDISTYNTDKYCSSESVHFPLGIVFSSVNFKSSFQSFQVWHLIELTNCFC